MYASVQRIHDEAGSDAGLVQLLPFHSVSTKQPKTKKRRKRVRKVK